MNLTKAEEFYVEGLKILKKSKIPFLVGGTYAVVAYVGIDRPTKDFDLFCKASDYPKILKVFSDQGYETSVEDERWLAKVSRDEHYLDFVFSIASMLTPVNDTWFKESHNAKILGVETAILPPTELILSKMFVQSRNKYEGSDVAHLVLKEYKNVNWRRLLAYLDPYWEVLLMHLLNFRFIYPSQREIIPRWLVDELLERLTAQINTPTSKVKICRGKLISPFDYDIDIKQWGFTDLIGGVNESDKNS
jgi:hypothetical protein